MQVGLRSEAETVGLLKGKLSVGGILVDKILNSAPGPFVGHALDWHPHHKSNLTKIHMKCLKFDKFWGT